MGRSGRLSLIRKIESVRGTRVLVYITGDRKNFETRIATDVFPFILEHLQKFGSVSKIDLFLYTSGGFTNAATGLVALLREFSPKFSVLIPFKAHSAGTLIALGADSIVMNHVSQLTPVDPSISSPYNPTIPSPQPGAVPQILPVNVEDVVGYLDLAKNEANLKTESALATVFQDLASKVHPLALGSVYRAREQIKLIATKLLKNRSKTEENEEQIKKIVSALTRELYSHDYIIGRNEAKNLLKLPVEEADILWDDPIWALYKEYENLLELTRPYNPEMLVGDSSAVTNSMTRAIIESTSLTHTFVTTREIRKVQVSPPGAPEPIIGFQERVISEGWIQYENKD
jgi:hypothetical protein